jgi:ATP-dependent RNA helicase RhlE
VINFDIPEVPGDYIHRIGRTGRINKEGIAISFINKVEQPYQKEIEKLMKKQIPLMPLPGDLAISNVYTEEERPTRLFDKNYSKGPSIKGSKGAFHEKSEKNKKVNIGGPKLRGIKFDKKGKPRNLKKRSGKTRF